MDCDFVEPKHEIYGSS